MDETQYTGAREMHKALVQVRAQMCSPDGRGWEVAGKGVRGGQEAGGKTAKPRLC
jgi:hypothetical protein